jgi:hypothetical protein
MRQTELNSYDGYSSIKRSIQSFFLDLIFRNDDV